VPTTVFSTALAAAISIRRSDLPLPGRGVTVAGRSGTDVARQEWCQTRQTKQRAPDGEPSARVRMRLDAPSQPS
jgi:hypothetical protein